MDVIDVAAVAHSKAFGKDNTTDRTTSVQYAPPQPIGAGLAVLNEIGDRRLWLSARALVLTTAGLGSDLWLSATCAGLFTSEQRSRVLKSLGRRFRSKFLVATAMFHPEGGTWWQLVAGRYGGNFRCGTSAAAFGNHFRQCLVSFGGQ